MEQKVQASERFKSINQDQDPVALFQLIGSIAHKHEGVKGGTMSLVEHDMGLYTCYQYSHWSNVEYYNLFKAARGSEHAWWPSGVQQGSIQEKALRDQGIKSVGQR